MQYEKETGMFLINGSLVSGNDVEDILYNHVKSAMDSAKEGVVIQTQGEHMKEALKLALEALKKVYDNVSFYGEVREAIAAIKEALAQPEQDYPEDFIHALAFHTAMSDLEPEQEQKLVGTVGDLFDERVISKRELDRDLLVYTTPTQRKPLTDEEIGKIVDIHTTDDGGYDICCSGHGVARAIEAAHGIKE